MSDRSAIVFVEPMPSSNNYKPCDPKLKFKPAASWFKEPYLFKGFVDGTVYIWDLRGFVFLHQ